MKKYIKIICWLSITAFILVPKTVQGEEFRKVGTSAAQFLKIGVGARALSMGGAFQAVANDASSVYWNPAGMTRTDQVSWIFNHTDWFLDTSHDFSSLVLPLRRGSYLGLSINVMTIGKEEITTEENSAGTGHYWDALGLSAGISYARRMTDKFSIGTTVKYVTERIWNESASSVAVDVGTILDTGYKGVVIGMSFSNFGSSMQLSGRDLIRELDLNEANSLNAPVDSRLHTEPWPLPVCFSIGTAIEIVGQADRIVYSDNQRLTLAVNGTHPNDDSEKLNMGMEWAINETVFLRGGYSYGKDLSDFSGGAGIKIGAYGRDMLFDYSIVPYEDLGIVHTYTISSTF